MSLKRNIIDVIAGRPIFQPFFELLYSASVYGMNYGNGGNFKNSGEIYVTKYIRSKLTSQKKKLQFFDVGANIGNYSVQLANSMSELDFKLYSFEPSPEIYKVLLERIKAKKKIHPFNIGFSDKTEVVSLYKRSALSGLSSVYKRRLDHFGIDMSYSEDIRVMKIDEFCMEQKIEEIHFLKMDVEGHELKCLQGATEMLRRNKIWFIQLEFGGCNIDSRTFFQDFWYLLNENFNIYRIVKNGLVPIKKYNERLEIFKNINFLAELKM